jgi:hypothetical protein
VPDANDLSLEEWQAVIGLIRDKIDTDRFPFSERIRVLRSALMKLDPKLASKPRKEPRSPLPSGPMAGSRRKDRG